MNKYENLYEKGKDYLQDINQDQISLIPRSAGFISPGDVLSFTYSGGSRLFVFVVKVRKRNIFEWTGEFIGCLF
jgi:hypothetical protein